VAKMQDSIDDALAKGLIEFDRSWIEKAVEQKAKNLTVGIANSQVMTINNSGFSDLIQYILQCRPNGN